MSDTSNETILNMIKSVTQAKDKMATSTPNSNRNWLTSCSYPDGPHGAINIQTAGLPDIIRLVRILILNRSVETDVGIVLDLPVNNEIHGFPYSSWIQDCQTRSSKIQLINQRKSLDNLEAKLNSLVSPELRRELELQSLLQDPFFTSSIK